MTLADQVNKMIATVLENAEFTSASPGFVNTLIQINQIDNPDLEKELNDSTTTESEKKDVKKSKEKLAEFDAGNVGEVNKMVDKQFRNVATFAKDPASFMLRTLGARFFKGVGKFGMVGLIAAIAIEVVNALKDELFKPGRIFDIRFREAIDKQILKFFERKEQMELKQGFKQIITTTVGGLRGATLAGQIGGNFYTPDRIPNSFLDPRVTQPPQTLVSSNDMRGNDSDRFHTGGAPGGRFPGK